MSDVYHGTRTGSFDWAHPSDKKQQVYLYTPAGNFSELWDDGEAPYGQDMLPSEVLDIIEERLDSYWISTRRDDDKKRIAACRERMPEFDAMWLTSRIAKKKLELSELESRLSAISEVASH